MVEIKILHYKIIICILISLLLLVVFIVPMVLYYGYGINMELGFADNRDSMEGIMIDSDGNCAPNQDSELCHEYLEMRFNYENDTGDPRD